MPLAYPYPDVDGTVVLAAVVGSTAYGLAGPASDVDRMGVYVTWGRNLLGLGVADAVSRTVVSHNPDSTIHELGKFSRLALAANPNVTELLWLAQYDTLNSDGRALVAIRRSFLSTTAVQNAYLGYARSQMQRARGRVARGEHGLEAGGAGRVEKAARHALRLVIAAEGLLTGGELAVHVGDRREEILEAGNLAAHDLDAYLTLMERELDRVAGLASKLPERPDRATVESTIAAIRRRSLAGCSGD